jgi:hypothetical protein
VNALVPLLAGILKDVVVDYQEVRLGVLRVLDRWLVRALFLGAIAVAIAYQAALRGGHWRI